MKPVLLTLALLTVLVACGAAAPRAQVATPTAPVGTPAATVDPDSIPHAPFFVVSYSPIPLPTPLPYDTPTPLPTATPEPVLPPQRWRALRDFWPTPVTPVSATTALWMSVNAPADTGGGRNTFWRIDLHDLSRREARASIPTMFSDAALFGQVSPDGSHIAYLDGNSKVATLHIMRSDGSDDRALPAVYGLGGLGCTKLFDWSPDGRYLAFITTEKGSHPINYELNLYAIATGALNKRIVHGGWIHLIGWRNMNTIIFTSNGQDSSKTNISIIEILTGKYLVIQDVNMDLQFGCEVLSPNREKFSANNMLFDLLGRGAIQMIRSSENTIWHPDSDRIWSFATENNGISAVITLDNPTKLHYFTLLPDATKSSRFSVTGSSPDGRYIVVCEGRPTVNGYFTAYNHLYDTQSERWSTLSQSPLCDKVLGWSSNP